MEKKSKEEILKEDNAKTAELSGYLQGKSDEKKRILEIIDWFYNDLGRFIDKTHNTAKGEITDGELARLIMEKGQLLLIVIKQEINKTEKEENGK